MSIKKSDRMTHFLVARRDKMTHIVFMSSDQAARKME
jgi:hypothetical protein